MINTSISNLLIIYVILMMCGWFVLPICALQPFNRAKSSLSDKIQKATIKEFVLDNSSNILRNSLNRDKNVTLTSHPLPYYTAARAFDTPSWQLTQTELKKHESADEDGIRRFVLEENIKIHNDFHYGINKSNQENNFYNIPKQPTPLLSDIKLVKSSTMSSSSTSSSSSRATASATESTNSTSSASSSSYFERVELHESLTRTKNEKLLLHRNKRYLLFPEGSSFQLVFDLIIPIVDYTNFAIMGITCAVAWELPSKPPSEIIENFRTKLNDGTFGLSRRNDSTQQQLKYIDSQRMEQEAVVDNKRWEEGIAVGTAGIYNQHYPQYQQHHQLSATVATTSGHEQFLTNAPKPPLPLPPPPSSSSSNLYYNNYRQREKFQQPPTSTTFFYSQHPQQQQQWHNYNFEAFDSNQRKTFYANDNRERPIYRNDFASQPNKNNYYQAHHPTNQWNAENWQPKKQQQQTKFPYHDADAGDYWNKDNWWERNKNRIEKHWQENQQKWSQYQENPHNYQTPMYSKRTGRNRKILNKPPKHRIYPIFGKRRRRRSTADHRAHLQNDNLAKILQDIHTREHLQTRQKLYGKIEKLYKTRGQNGTACVLRALCETEKMHAYAHYNQRPQSFVMELLRSIFALPKDTLTNSKDSSLHLHSRYTDAVLRAHDVTQSCSEQYYDCEYSITYDT